MHPGYFISAANDRLRSRRIITLKQKQTLKKAGEINGAEIYQKNEEVTLKADPEEADLDGLHEISKAAIHHGCGFIDC